MEFIQIKSFNDPYADKLVSLYLEAFPSNQRHTESDFKTLIGTKENYHCNVVLLNGAFVGFFNYWDFDAFLYAEHFAIEEAVRGNKIGEKVMKMIKSMAEAPMVFEAELPDTEIASRRIEFYRRLGYEIVPVEYMQPPYNKDGYYQQLHLMSDDVDFVLQHFDFIRKTVYQNVYHVTG